MFVYLSDAENVSSPCGLPSISRIIITLRWIIWWGEHKKQKWLSRMIAILLFYFLRILRHVIKVNRCRVGNVGINRFFDVFPFLLRTCKINVLQ